MPEGWDKAEEAYEGAFEDIGLPGDGRGEGQGGGPTSGVPGEGPMSPEPSDPNGGSAGGDGAPGANDDETTGEKGASATGGSESEAKAPATGAPKANTGGVGCNAGPVGPALPWLLLLGSSLGLWWARRREEL